MKNVFSRNFQKGNSEILYGEEYVIAENCNNDEGRKGFDPIITHTFLHMALQFGKVILGILGIIVIGKAGDSKNTVLYVMGIAAILLAVFLHFYSKNKLQEAIYRDTYDKSEKNEYSSKKEQLGILEEAKQIEIMYTLFEPENVDFVTYQNENVYAFREEENLCFLTNDKKLVFPISDITAIKEIKKAAALDMWNKDVNFDDGIYKKYHIKSDASIYDQHYITTDYGRGVVIPYYYSIVLKNNYEIVVPPYEIDVVLELTGMQVEK